MRALHTFLASSVFSIAICVACLPAPLILPKRVPIPVRQLTAAYPPPPRNRLRTRWQPRMVGGGRR